MSQSANQPQPASQANEPFEEPPRDQIPTISRMHVEAGEQSDSDEIWVGAGMNQVIVQTVGRKSGKTHKIMVPYWVDENGHRIVVASYAGGPKHPAWFHNLSDKSANPEIMIRERQHRYWSDAEVLDGDDYERTWAALTADRPFYLDYQSRCERRIPLIRLPETRPV